MTKYLCYDVPESRILGMIAKLCSILQVEIVMSMWNVSIVVDLLIISVDYPNCMLGTNHVNGFLVYFDGRLQIYDDKFWSPFVGRKVDSKTPCKYCGGMIKEQGLSCRTCRLPNVAKTIGVRTIFYGWYGFTWGHHNQRNSKIKDSFTIKRWKLNSRSLHCGLSPKY